MMRTQFNIPILLLTAIGLTGLGGCASRMPDPIPLATTHHHPIQIAESVERLELYARPNGMELSVRDQMAVEQFIGAYANNGDGPLYINMPGNYASSPGIVQTRALINTAMSRSGLYNIPVQEGQYQSRPGLPAPVIVSYRRLKTVQENCALSSDLMDTRRSLPYDNFGCAASANLAAMISDPRQLVEPYPMAPADTKRRMTVYDKYIKGEVTSASEAKSEKISVGGN